VRGLTGLLRVDLPGGVARLCDGAFFDFASERYLARDPVLGTIASINDLSEGLGNEIPALDITFNPPGPIAISVLSQAALQRRSIRLWLAEYEVETGLIVGTPELRFDGFVDQPAIRDNETEYSVSLVAVPWLEYFFDRDDGNTLSSSFHKSIFAGETGHDQATGLGVGVAWGAETPATGNARVVTTASMFRGIQTAVER